MRRHTFLCNMRTITLDNAYNVNDKKKFKYIQEENVNAMNKMTKSNLNFNTIVFTILRVKKKNIFTVVDTMRLQYVQRRIEQIYRDQIYYYA